MSIRHSLFALFAILCLASCDKMSTVTYKIKNMATDSIRIISVRKDGTTLITDTFKISYNQTATIGRVDKGFSHISSYKPTGTVLEDFSQIDIYKVTTGTKAKTNFLLTSQWTYTENGAHLADEATVVTENDL